MAVAPARSHRVHRHHGHHGHGHHGHHGQRHRAGHPRHAAPDAPPPRTAHAAAPAGLAGMWWEGLAEAERLVELIHAGWSHLRSNVSGPSHNAPPLTRRIGIEPAAPTPTGHRLGNLSMLYETGCVPGQEAKAAATVSSGRNDPGGKSYGAYQFNSTVATGAVVKIFLAAVEGKPWAAGFVGHDPTVAGPFEVEWKRVAAAQPVEFFEAQHVFIKRTHYDRAMAKVLTATKVDLTTASAAVRDVVWSMSVQHGRAAKIIAAAVEACAGHGNPGERAYDRLLIDTLYDKRIAYVAHLNLESLNARYKSERAGALKMLDGTTGGPP